MPNLLKDKMEDRMCVEEDGPSRYGSGKWRLLVTTPRYLLKDKCLTGWQM